MQTAIIKNNEIIPTQLARVVKSKNLLGEDEYKIVPLFGTMPAEIKWVEPIKNNNDLRFISIYQATKNGNNLEVI